MEMNRLIVLFLIHCIGPLGLNLRHKREPEMVKGKRDPDNGTTTGTPESKDKPDLLSEKEGQAGGCRKKSH